METYPVGSIVRFHFCWFNRTNPHDGHKCRVIQSEIDVRIGSTGRKTKYRRYVLEDLHKRLSERAKRIFRMTDTSANGTTLTLVKK